MLKVTTDGRDTHVYVGFVHVPIDPETGRPDPIELALAQLRADCRKDMDVLMDGLRVKAGMWTYRGPHRW